MLKLTSSRPLSRRPCWRCARRALATATMTAAGFVGTACSSGDSAPPTAPPTPPGTVAVSTSGLPEGASADVRVSGPLPGTTFSRTATGAVSWTDVPAGRYAVQVRPVRTALGTWVGDGDAFEITVPGAGQVQVTALYRPAPSAFTVLVSGLPATAAPAVTLTVPRGGPAAVTSGSTVVAPPVIGTPTAPERWQLAATPVSAAGARFAPSRTALDTAVSFGDTARVAIEYRVATGSIAVAVTGLPAGLSGSVKVMGPGTDTTARSLTATATIGELEPGRYRVISAPVARGGITYRPAADTLVVDVAASLVAAPATVTYVAQVGRLVLQAAGLPSSTAPALRLTGQGIDRTFTGSGTVDSLPAGSYTVSATPVRDGVDRWAPTPATQTVTVVTGASTTANVTYSLATGALAVTSAGLPTGLAADIRVSGPGGFARTVTGSDTLRGLEPGRYTLTPRVVRSTTEAYGVPAGIVAVDVVAGPTPASAGFAWVQVPTVVDVPVAGLPAGTSAAIQLIDPTGATTNVTGTTRVSPAAAGRWRQTASAVATSVARYTPVPAARDTTVLPGDTLHFGVQYTLATGSLAVAVTGLPSGTGGNVTVSGPGGYVRTLSATTTLVLLTPGTYTVTAQAVSTSGGSYQPTPATQTVAVTASAVAAGATVAYGLATGSVAITASGLPAGAAPVFTLTGPGATRTQTGPGTVTGLAVGTWTVTAASVTVSGTTYTPTPTTATAAVTANATSAVSFAYSAPVAGQNYAIRHVYLTQAIQKLDNSVTLVAGREALLRVFVTATEANSARPDVRVRLYNGASLVSTTTIPAPEASVRTAIAEGTLGSTWNLVVPAGTVTSALRVLVDLDPAQTLTEATRTDNTWPASGTPQAVSVATAPPLTVRFVPIVTATDTGRVTSANRESFLTATRRLFPVQTVTSDVRAPFTSSADTLRSNDSNGKWLTVLSEVNALRASDGAPATTHYYGVVRVRYTSGVAGYGYVPGRAAVGWDYLPSGNEVTAHELGHNFGRGHAPCDVSGEPGYPYAGGLIGGYGWNAATNSIVPNTAPDIMGYCNSPWISDYTWSGVLTYRATTGFMAPAQAAVRGEGLLVWGRVVNGRIELEPAFRVTAPATPAPRAATHEVALLDGSGQALTTLPLEAAVVDHAPAGEEHRHFAVVLPWSAALETGLQRIRVRDLRVPTRAAELRAAEPPPEPTAAAPTGRVGTLRGDPAVELAREPGRVRVRWEGAAYRMAMVRDTATGELMGFVRTPGAAVATGGRTVEVVFSDGVRSTVRR